MTPEKKSSNINTESIPHSGTLKGKLQEGPYNENVPSVQGVNTSEIPTLLPEHSGQLILTDEERDSEEFQAQTDAQRAYHEQRTTESETEWSPRGNELLTDNTEEGKKSKKSLFIKIGGAAAALGVALTTYLSTQSGHDKIENGPAPTQPVATAKAIQSTLPSQVETTKPTHSAAETAPGSLNEFGITDAEYKKVVSSVSISATEYTTPKEVTDAFMASLNNYYAGGHDTSDLNKHLTADTPSGRVGWNAWAGELYTKAIQEGLFVPGYVAKSDNAIGNLSDNKTIANRLWANSAKANENEYKVTQSFTIENIVSTSDNAITVVGTELRTDNSSEVPSAASDSAKFGTHKTPNSEIIFVKVGDHWLVSSYTKLN